MDTLPVRSFEAMKRQATNGGRKNRRRPGNLREQMSEEMQRAYDESREENDIHKEQKHLWPTPTTRDYKGVPPDGYFRDGELQTDTVDRAVHAVSDGNKNGQLNPTWVEWLMGWPIGWTSMEPITELDWRDWKTDPADEGEVPRVATGTKHRVGRLKAIGNGQVPQVAALAWRILTNTKTK